MDPLDLRLLVDAHATLLIVLIWDHLDKAYIVSIQHHSHGMCSAMASCWQFVAQIFRIVPCILLDFAVVA